jgi:hypothetical protein
MSSSILGRIGGCSLSLPKLAQPSKPTKAPEGALAPIPYGLILGTASAPKASTPHASLSMLWATMPVHRVGAEPLGGSCVPFASWAVDYPSMRGIKQDVLALSGPFAMGAS